MNAVSPVVRSLEANELQIGAGQPQYDVLPSICGADLRLTSRWRPSPEEREAIANGADVMLTVLTFGRAFQPTMVYVVHPDAALDEHWAQIMDVGPLLPAQAD